MNEFEHEPIRGLPGLLPAGETILWQGAPDWRRLAVEAFHVRKVAIYFVVLIAWSIASALADGEPGRALSASLWQLAFALAAIGILLLLASVTARSTVYTITNRRVVLRYGVALPMAVNLPFRTIGAASLRINSDGSGDIPLTLATSDHLAWLVLWPHTRPWHLTRPQPMLRAVPDARVVADLLSAALRSSAPAAAMDAAPRALVRKDAPAVPGREITGPAGNGALDLAVPS